MVLFIQYVVLTFEFVDEILWWNHSNETSSAVLSHGTIYLVVLTFEFVDEILWCYHSNETSSAVLSHGTIYFIYFFHWPLDIRGVIYLLGRSVGLVRSIWTTRANSETWNTHWSIDTGEFSPTILFNTGVELPSTDSWYNILGSTRRSLTWMTKIYDLTLDLNK